MNTKQTAELLHECLAKGAALGGMDALAMDRLRAMSLQDITEGMGRTMTVPVAFADADAPLFHDAYYVTAWLGVARLLGGGAPLRVMEVASGDVAVVPFALELYDRGGSSYVTANLNRQLTENFRSKTAALRTSVRVVEDDGANLDKYYGPGSFDLVALQHGINDIVQTIICEAEGMDTVHGDWWQNLPEMCRITADYHRSGRLEDASREGFLACMRACASLVRPGGHLAFNSIVYEYDLGLGYPRDLYEDIVPMARRWMLSSDMGLTEVTPADWDHRWWMILRTPEEK